MTRNLLTDGDPFSVAVLNSMMNAHDGEAVVDGCDLTPGTDDWDVDVGSGELFVDGGFVAVESQTVTVSTADADDRIDLVTIDTDGSASVTEGSPASTAGQPIAPDMPDGEVLAGLVYVRGGSDEVLDGDLYDYRTAIADPREMQTTIWSDGADGEQVFDANDTISGVLEPSRFEIEASVTVQVNEWAVVIASEEIVIDGMLTATGEGAPGGAGAPVADSSNGDPGDPGGDAIFVPIGPGGAGGAPQDDSGAGGPGGDGDPEDPIRNRRRFAQTVPIDFLAELTDAVGAGGGGGGSPIQNASDAGSGNAGQEPGGGGSGGATGASGADLRDGADGGPGGGLIVLIAPEITITGTVEADGVDGDSPESADSPGASGGGGGGGSGGMVFVQARIARGTGNISADRGAGAPAPADGVNGGTGADGADGVVKILAASTSTAA